MIKNIKSFKTAITYQNNYYKNIILYIIFK